MATSDAKLREYIEALAAEGHGGRALEDLEADNITKVGKMRIARDRAIRDMEAARLLPLGADVVAIRQNCHRSTAYRRAERAQIVAAS